MPRAGSHAPMACPFDPELEDLIRRNRLLIAEATHLACDTAWLICCLRHQVTYTGATRQLRRTQPCLDDRGHPQRGMTTLYLPSQRPQPP